MLSSQASKKSADCSLPAICVYGVGECANSLVMNGVFGFAMLFFTKSLGLSPAWAGLAMSVSVVWEAMFEPIMGHISDNTRSRWGRRHPYMLIGGVLMAICSCLIWYVPDGFRTSQLSIFSYVVAINLLLRTGLTMFFIPYMALGFEMCSDYQGRARLQSIRQIANMAANFAGPALAWVIFFKDSGTVRGTTVAENYLHMGAVFACCTLVFVLIAVIFTFRYHEDTRSLPHQSNASWLHDFFADMKQILRDPNPRWVFAFIFIVCAGMVLVSSLQIFVYDDFMHFSPRSKSIAHGSTMVGMALGAFLSVSLARRFDKRGAVLLGGTISVGANFLLGVIFLTGLTSGNSTWVIAGQTVSLDFILFVPLHAAYWLGNGIMLPLANSMMADVAEIHQLHSGLNKDGAYSSVFSLSMRMAISFSLMMSGYCLDLIGYQVPHNGDAVVQSATAVWRLGAVTFLVGAMICLLALLAIRRYPVTKSLLEQIRLSKAHPAI